MANIIEAIIERAKDGTYSVYCKGEIFSGAGDTIEVAKADMARQMEFYRQTAKEEGFRYPAFLDADYEVNYTFDITSLVSYYVNSGIFSLASLEKVTGINQKQLWSYVNGTTPRKAQIDRITAGVKKLKPEFNTIFA